MTPDARPRLLAVGPLPPPLGGVQLMNEMLIGSSLARDFEIETVNTSKGRARWAVETQSWRTPVDFVKHAARLVAAIVRFRPDVVYLHAASGISFSRDWALMMIARFMGRRVVCHYHGTRHTLFPSTQTAFGRWAGRTMMGAANRVIVLSPGYRDAYVEAWGRKDLAWSPNLVDLRYYEGLAKTAPWLAPGERAVLFMGRLSAPKGIFDLFDAMETVLAKHADVRFVLAGVAETEAQEPVLRADIERRGFASRVTFLGSVEGREKALAYATSTVIAIPSWTEAFPLVIPEAMAGGLPMVVTAVGAIPDFVVDEEDGLLIPPRDPKALAAALDRLLGDEPLRARMAKRVRDRAEKEFAVEVGAARVRVVLNRMLSASDRR